MSSPEPEFECKQIFIAHEAVWESMRAWAFAHNMHLDLIPTTNPETGALTLDYGPDDTPTYAFMPKMPGDRER